MQPTPSSRLVVLVGGMLLATACSSGGGKAGSGGAHAGAGGNGTGDAAGSNGGATATGGNTGLGGASAGTGGRGSGGTAGSGGSGTARTGDATGAGGTSTGSGLGSGGSGGLTGTGGATGGTIGSGGAGTGGATVVAGDDFVSNVKISVLSQTATVLVVTWTQLKAADNTWLEFSFSGSGVMSSRALAGATGSHRDVVLGVPEKTAVTVRIVSKLGGVDYQTKDYQGTTGALPSGLPKPTLVVHDAALASPEPWLLGAVDSSPGGCSNPSCYYSSTFWIYIMDRRPVSSGIGRIPPTTPHRPTRGSRATASTS
jgi:hypothetical protein